MEILLIIYQPDPMVIQNKKPTKDRLDWGAIEVTEKNRKASTLEGGEAAESSQFITQSWLLTKCYPVNISVTSV